VRRAVIVLLALAFSASAADAQSGSAPAAGVAFLPRFDFYVSMEHLSSEEARFVWDANWGGDIDLLDYGAGRVSFVANYETVLGSEFRAFDPNQGNYILEGSASVRGPIAEFAAVFHHVSRHLSDRPKRFAIDWNMIGGRVRAAATRGRSEIAGHVDLRGAVQKSYVDYRWEFEGGGRAQVGLRPRVALVAAGRVQILGVDGSRSRGAQHGLRGEGGVRIEGRGAALELFAAAERRVDPFQLEFSTATWLSLGFRLASR
jgi:hypothetical protein